MQTKNNNAESGFSVIEILTTLGIFSLILIASASFFTQMNRKISEEEYAETRMRMFQNLIYIMGMPATLRGSLEYDATQSGNLSKCIRGGMGAVPTTPLPVALFLPVVSGDATFVRTSGQISGSPNRPLRYSIEGTACTAANPINCNPSDYPISVTTEFLPVCPPAYDYYYGYWTGPVYPNGLTIPSVCGRAQYIKIFYRFFTTPGAAPHLSFSELTGSMMVSAVLANIAI